MAASLTPAIAIHAGAAITALGIGAALLVMRKGSSRHRLLGRSWAVAMLAVALSAFFIGSGFSWLHALAVAALVGLAGAVRYARAGNPRAHRKAVVGLYVGGLVIPGLFALLPQRILGGFVWSALGLA
ncbi:MAG: DUF2306 domain-containing protein [Burkholderiales bacterium]|jgi:uncharacterized membrane protein|nr:DUF2306 domain-containing protein [Burkholderiales bacterium]